MKIWGGIIKKRIRKSPASEKICTGYEWVLSHKQSLLFIEDIKPFMLIPTKIKQIDKVIDTFENGEKLYYKCYTCDKIYANPSARRRHNKNVHQNTDASEVNTSQENQIAGSS
jgi:hypothetical protein